ncbi:hypothetical protein LC065_07060 [Halobacillus litoralis]|uniref:hypothetical protein n=1 Tax=Halobacillus litoralis TaxID=45668 RepID=UPI00273FC070|nr:hypothetical protein [Halobacillus litoralis]WLR48919.1 hypothetical protein LC065_07060 [Halobacillus litoralis]
MRIDLYRAGTMLTAGTLLDVKDLQPGLVEGEVEIDEMNLDGSYLAIVTVGIDKKESIYPFPIYIEGNG